MKGLGGHLYGRMEDVGGQLLNDVESVYVNNLAAVMEEEEGVRPSFLELNAS